MREFTEFKVVKVGNREHVVREVESRGYNSMGGKISDANYLGTGMALCAVLDKGQSLASWINKR